MRLSEDEKAELVAYLDGELDDAATQAVEAKIATDADARAELDALKQTWGMLDYLPKASPSVNFTHRTMERLTLEVGAGKKTMPIAGRGRAWLGGVGWAAAVLLALAGGYFAALHLWPQPDPEPERPLAVERDPDWLEQLRKDDPQAWQAIKDASDEATRLALIKDQRDREWMQGQPKSYREQWTKLQGEARGKFVAKLRLEERQKHQRWLIAQRFWKELETQKSLPCRLSDFAFEPKGKAKEPAKTVNRVETYVNDYLKPYMTVQEEEQLREAEGHWPDYPMALVEIASRRTPALPPIGKELRKFDDVPRPVRNKLIDAKLPKEIKKNTARYHQLDGSAAFATRLVEMAAKDSKLPFDYEYLASNPASLQRAVMKKFYDDVLVPAVKKDPDDFHKLTGSEGKWPDFPLAIQDLARKHNLNPPWFVLPEQDRWHWDRYRTRGQESGVRSQQVPGE